MGIEDTTSGNRNRWRTARERNRLKARYDIQSRITSLISGGSDFSNGEQPHQPRVGVDGPSDPSDNSGSVGGIGGIGWTNGGAEELPMLSSNIQCSCNSDCDRTDTAANQETHGNANNFERKHSKLTSQDVKTILKFFQAVIKNDVSLFSAVKLAQHGHLLNESLPVELLGFSEASTQVSARCTDCTDIHSRSGNSEGRNTNGTNSNMHSGNSDGGNDSVQEKENEIKHQFSMLFSTLLPWENQQNDLNYATDHDESSSGKSQQSLHLTSQKEPSNEDNVQPTGFNLKQACEFPPPSPSHKSSTSSKSLTSSTPSKPPRLPPHEQPQPTTLATSKYGPSFVANRLVPYIQHVRQRTIFGRQLSLMEYASLLGRHHVVGLLLLGGVDPTVCNSPRGTYHTGGRVSSGRQELASQRVLALLHSLPSSGSNIDDAVENQVPFVLPMSIWSYVVRAVVEMRMNEVLDCNKRYSLEVKRSTNEDKAEGSSQSRCNINQCSNCHEIQTTPLLNFGSPCHHSFCEPCMWIHFVGHIPLSCSDLAANVVTCPMCDNEFEGFQYCEGDCNYRRQKMETEDSLSVNQSNPSSKDGTVSLGDYSLTVQEILHESKDGESPDIHPCLQSPHLQKQREQRCKTSLAKFLDLPATNSELKLQSKQHPNKKQHPFRSGKRKKERDPIHSTWNQALQPLMTSNQSRDVRTDRFFKSLLSSPPMVMAYLQSGIDVNAQNIYGQTPLYIACWKGMAMVVQWLLEYGADGSIVANGGSCCWSVALKGGRGEVVRLLESYGWGDPCAGMDWRIGMNDNVAQEFGREHGTFELSILIDREMDHPGAGACIVDSFLLEDQVQQLEALAMSLPVADASDNENNEYEREDGVESSGKTQYRPTRAYFCDAEHHVQAMLAQCVRLVQQRAAMTHHENQHPLEEAQTLGAKAASPPQSIFQHIRFLQYEQKGGILPPHVDLCRLDESSGYRSTHTFILYLTDCESGGGTALLKHLSNPEVLAVAQPKRGRALIFPHLCPHSGLEVESVPKILLRGEIYIGA